MEQGFLFLYYQPTAPERRRADLTYDTQNTKSAAGDRLRRVQREAEGKRESPRAKKNWRKCVMYEKVSTDLNFVDRGKKVEKFWKDEKSLKKSIDSRRKGTPYVFL